MNIVMKQAMVLTAALMIGTSCFAMEAGYLEGERGTTTTPREREREEGISQAPAIEVPSESFLDSIPTEVKHSMFVTAANEDVEDFQNMILVSRDWFRILTGTGETFPEIYSKKYYYFIKGISGFTHYNSSEFLKGIHQITVASGLSFGDRQRMGRGQVVNAVTSPICSFPNPRALTRLSLDHQLMNPESVLSWQNCTNLEHLNMQGCIYHTLPEGLSVLETFSKLTSLILSFTSGGAKLEFVSGLTNLQRLNLSRSALPLPDLKNLHQLESLGLGSQNLDELDPNFFSIFTNLKELDISSCKLKDLNHLSKLTNPHKVKTLRMSCNTLKPMDSEFFLSFTNLEKLEMSECQLIGPKWLFNLKKLTELQDLDLRENLLTNALEADFSDLTNLKSLRISSNLIGKCPLLPEGLETFEADEDALVQQCDRLPLSLTSLNIIDSETIDHFGGDEILSLTRLTNLQDLYPFGDLTEELKEMLKEKLPNLLTTTASSTLK